MLLVAGGTKYSTKNSYWSELNTTEILSTIDGVEGWTMVASLPYYAWNLSGATLSNIVFMIGEYRSLYSE